MRRSASCAEIPPLLVLALPLALLATLLAGCGGGQEAERSAGAAAPAEGSGEEPRRVRVMNTLPPFRLVSQYGEPFASRDLEGKVWIANFIFTRCTQTCPLQTEELRKLQEAWRRDPALRGVHFVSITVDPGNDGPEVLREYAREHKIDSSNWSFLTGRREEIWALSRDGFGLPVDDAPGDPATLITHSQNFVLVDRARRVRGHYDGLDAGARESLARDLRAVLGDPPGPPTEPKNVTRTAPVGNIFYEPPEIRDPAWMKARAEAQTASAGRFGVFHGFRFTDRYPESGIDFQGHAVEDAGKHYKAVHYDHGCGVAVADVDGDGLEDVYLVRQVGGNHLYRNLGGGRFEAITDSAGVGVSGRIGVSASFADIDNDGDADLYVTTVRHGNLLFENDGKGKFRDISRKSGVDYTGHSSSAVFFDYDRDGLLDLFLANVGDYTTEEVGADGYYVGLVDAFSGHLRPGREEQSILYRNMGGNRFADVSKATGLVDLGWTGAASPIDLNEDGWQDLYVLSMQGHDEYWENAGGERFVRRSREVFPRTPWGSMGIKVFDFDNDGRMDIYITDMHTDMTDDALQVNRLWYAEKMKITEKTPPRLLATDGNHVMGNAFFRNEGGGRFTEISEAIGAETYWPWGLSTGDLNADGWEDVFVAASMNYPFRYAVNSVLLNDRGRRLLDSEFILGVEPRRGGRTSTHWFDLDCDGEDSDHLHCEGRTGTYQVHAALGSRSSALFDMDGDGDLDILTNDFNSEPMVLVSDLAARRPDIGWLAVRLVGSRSNRAGIGARVTVRSGGLTLVKVHDGQSGYLSQSLMPLYFGLDGARKLDAIEIAWPSSGTQRLAGPIEANQVLTITEE